MIVMTKIYDDHDYDHRNIDGDDADDDDRQFIAMVIMMT